VVYDPEDPHADLYDVDDGMLYLLVLLDYQLITSLTESTVITLSDWYHTPAPAAGVLP
jgi:iron transport multicopper oxidase